MDSMQNRNKLNAITDQFDRFNEISKQVKRSIELTTQLPNSFAYLEPVPVVVPSSAVNSLESVGRFEFGEPLDPWKVKDEVKEIADAFALLNIDGEMDEDCDGNVKTSRNDINVESETLDCNSGRNETVDSFKAETGENGFAPSNGNGDQQPHSHGLNGSQEQETNLNSGAPNLHSNRTEAQESNDIGSSPCLLQVIDVKEEYDDHLIAERSEIDNPSHVETESLINQNCENDVVQMDCVKEEEDYHNLESTERNCCEISGAVNHPNREIVTVQSDDIAVDDGMPSDSTSSQQIDSGGNIPVNSNNETDVDLRTAEVNCSEAHDAGSSVFSTDRVDDIQTPSLGDSSPKEETPNESHGAGNPQMEINEEVSGDNEKSICRNAQTDDTEMDCTGNVECDQSVSSTGSGGNVQLIVRHAEDNSPPENADLHKSIDLDPNTQITNLEFDNIQTKAPPVIQSDNQPLPLLIKHVLRITWPNQEESCFPPVMQLFGQSFKTVMVYGIVTSLNVEQNGLAQRFVIDDGSESIEVTWKASKEILELIKNAHDLDGELKSCRQSGLSVLNENWEPNSKECIDMLNSTGQIMNYIKRSIAKQTKLKVFGHAAVVGIPIRPIGKGILQLYATFVEDDSEEDRSLELYFKRNLIRLYEEKYIVP